MSARPLIGFLGCVKDRDDAQQQRETWLAGCPIDHRYFVGTPDDGPSPLLLPDEVLVVASDGYTFLPFKTRAMCRWALDNGYTHLFKCDTDTYARPERLLASGFEAWDYSGFFRGKDYDGNDVATGHYCSGGCGYWLSERAMALVAEARTEENRLRGDGVCYVNGEDVQTGRIMRANGVPCHWDDRYKLRPPGPMLENDYITLSDVVRPLRGGKMLKYHKEWKEAGGL